MSIKNLFAIFLSIGFFISSQSADAKIIFEGTTVTLSNDTSDIAISNTLTKHVAELQNITTLRVKSQKVSASQLIELIKKCPKLSIINLTGSTIPQNKLAQIRQACPFPYVTLTDKNGKEVVIQQKLPKKERKRRTFLNKENIIHFDTPAPTETIKQPEPEKIQAPTQQVAPVKSAEEKTKVLLQASPPISTDKVENPIVIQLFKEKKNLIEKIASINFGPTIHLKYLPKNTDLNALQANEHKEPSYSVTDVWKDLDLFSQAAKNNLYHNDFESLKDKSFTEAAQWCLDNGMDPNSLDATGTPLISLCRLQTNFTQPTETEIIDVIQLLIDAGADLNKTSNNETAISVANSMGKCNVGNFLLKKGASLHKEYEKEFIKDLLLPKNSEGASQKVYTSHWYKNPLIWTGIACCAGLATWGVYAYLHKKPFVPALLTRYILNIKQRLTSQFSTARTHSLPFDTLCYSG